MSEVFNGQTRWRPIPKPNTNNSHNLPELKLCLPRQPDSLHFPRKLVNTQLSFCLSSASVNGNSNKKGPWSFSVCMFVYVSVSLEQKLHYINKHFPQKHREEPAVAWNRSWSQVATWTIKKK